MSLSSCIPKMSIRHPELSPPQQFYPNSSWFGLSRAAIEAATVFPTVSERTMHGLIRRRTMVPIRCCWQGLWLAPGIRKQELALTRRQQRLHQHGIHCINGCLLLQQADRQWTSNRRKMGRMRRWTRARRKSSIIVLAFKSLCCFYFMDTKGSQDHQLKASKLRTLKCAQMHHLL